MCKKSEKWLFERKVFFHQILTIEINRPLSPQILVVCSEDALELALLLFAPAVAQNSAPVAPLVEPQRRGYAVYSADLEAEEEVSLRERVLLSNQSRACRKAK